jgi:hypothetical protein
MSNKIERWRMEVSKSWKEYHYASLFHYSLNEPKMLNKNFFGTIFQTVFY